MDRSSKDSSILDLKPFSEELIKNLTECKPEPFSKIFPDNDPKDFVNFDQIGLAHLIVGSGERKVTVIKDVPLTKAIELTEKGRLCHFCILGNFRGKDLIKMSDGEYISPPTFFNCMIPFVPFPVPDPNVIVDAYMCDTETLIALTRTEALYYCSIL